jgi:hypothetical protein
MTKKLIWMLVCSIMIASCAKLVEPGSQTGPMAVPSIAAPALLPTIEPTETSIESPLPTPFDSPLASPLESPLAAPGVIGQETLVQQAMDELSGRLGLSTSEIAVLSVNQVELSIPDVACPAANSTSVSPVTPAQTIGWEIVLTAHQINYTYHAHGRDIVPCTPQP